MNTTYKQYIIYSLSMANWLVRCGHDMIAVDDAPNDPTSRRKAFFFRDCPKLREDMARFRRKG